MMIECWYVNEWQIKITWKLVSQYGKQQTRLLQFW